MSNPRRLLGTYRLQLNADFTLDDARARVPYIAGLAVSHLYLSPVLAARAGSTHGYDVTDPSQVSVALGGLEAFHRLAHAAHQQGLGLVLDIVPNHMGIGIDNPYWESVLMHGARSRYADWFDVSWRAETKRLAGKVLVPILGDTLEHVLARDELRVTVSDEGARIRYFEHSVPVDPATLPPELEVAVRDPSAREILDAWSAGEYGRARLRSLLRVQHYELAFWRAAQRDVNYRRFFDVNELVCLRVEREDVFDATHAVVLQMVADGMIDGLRVDHIDGLLEPRRYLERLRAAVDARQLGIPIVVEKILASNEALPEDWPVEGTTGYEFMTTLEDVFIDPAGAAAMEARYHDRRGARTFRAVALASKRRVLRSTLNADVRRIAPLLAAVAKSAGWPSRPIAAYAGAIVEVVTQLTVYRTYIDSASPGVSPRDRAVLASAIARARTDELVDTDALDALERAFLGDWANAEPALARARLTFVLRLQQLTGPAAAKGVEDTALYVYAPVSSRNEVGGDPGEPLEHAVRRLHARLAERAERHPRSLNATNTHDTKRSADARARLDALSEHADEWERTLDRWRRWHRSLRTMVKGRLAPARTADNFIYQALIGVWPLTAAQRRAEGADPAVEVLPRLTAYLQKAMREAKVDTSWTDPDAEYEAAIERYVAGMLDRSGEHGEEFIADLDRFVALLAPQAMWNMLGRLVVHLMAPGIPDVYQGDELWFAALVDPDNRRPVDWAVREETWERVGRAVTGPDRLDHVRRWRDAMQASELKMMVTILLLALRRENILTLAHSYEPLVAEGEHADRVFGFRRLNQYGGQVVVIVARRTAALGPLPVGEVWGDTRVSLQTSMRLQCAVHRRDVPSSRGVVRLAAAFSVLPMCVLWDSPHPIEAHTAERR